MKNIGKRSLIANSDRRYRYHCNSLESMSEELVYQKRSLFEELTPGMRRDLIKKIVIHEGDKRSGHRQQRIDIYCTFISGAAQVVAQLKRKGKAA